MKNMSQPDKAVVSHLRNDASNLSSRVSEGRQRGTASQDPLSSASADLLQQDSNEHRLTESVDPNENSPLHQAALIGDWENASRFLDQHPEAVTAVASANLPQQADSNVNMLLMWADRNENNPLYQAALRGDWKEAKRFLDQHPEAATAVVAPFLSTALHVAAREGHSNFVANMVELMPSEDLAALDAYGRTALHIGAIAGIRANAAKAMVSKNPKLPNIVHKSMGWCPLLYAAHLSSKSKDLIWYLCLVTKDEGDGFPFTGPFASNLLLTLTARGHLDIILCLLKLYPSLATARMQNMPVTILSTLAETPNNFLSGSRHGFLSRFIYSCIPVLMKYGPPNHITSLASGSNSSSENLSKILCISTQQEGRDSKFLRWLRRQFLMAITLMTPNLIRSLRDEKLRHNCAVALVENICNVIYDNGGTMLYNNYGEHYILYNAARYGLIEIVKKLLQICPEIMWVPLGGGFKSLMHVAIEYRQKEVFGLFYGRKSDFGSEIPYENGTILHLVAKLAPLPQLTLVSGSALQVQNELQWFKTVAKFVYPFLLTFKDPKDNITAQELFTKEHKQLVESGEKWMKDTANSCMIVSTLIATFVFAAAFTVPGGNNGDGLPIYLWTKSFIVFVAADALALFSSVTALLMFFSIITARYAEEDFYKSLPKKLIIGLAALFLSVATMVVAFGATLFIILNERLKWIALPITLIASLPISTFVLLQFPLFLQMYRSTFVKSIFNSENPW